MKRFLVPLIVAGALVAPTAHAQSRELQALVREAQAFAKHIQSTARPEGKL